MSGVMDIPTTMKRPFRVAVERTRVGNEDGGGTEVVPDPDPEGGRREIRRRSLLKDLICPLGR